MEKVQKVQNAPTAESAYFLAVPSAPEVHGGALQSVRPKR